METLTLKIVIEDTLNCDFKRVLEPLLSDPTFTHIPHKCCFGG